MNEGEVGILNVGAGDIRISFDGKNPAELIRAKRIVKDMLRGGYALLVKVGDHYQRALDFDEATCEYVIADYDPTAGGLQGEDLGRPEPGHRDAIVEARTCECGCGRAVKPNRRFIHGHQNKKRVPAKKAHAVAVSRSAGG